VEADQARQFGAGDVECHQHSLPDAVVTRFEVRKLAAMQPTVSVLVPSFNSGDFLPLALRSALDQEDVELEILLQDGGSTDGSLEHAVSELADARVSLRVEPDRGQADALNRALDRAVGTWIAWLNADDLLEPRGLRLLLDGALEDVEAVFGDFRTIDAHGRELKRYRAAPLEVDRLLRHGHYVFSGALLVRRDLLLRLGGFRRELAYCMDYDLLLRIAAGAKSRHVEAIVASYREQPASKTSTAALGFLREHVRVAREHGGFRRDRAAGTARAILSHTAYRATRRLWNSDLWRRLRPDVQRGGRG
jgi:glycosyltransferase involved in cell wall biosynthesis